MHGVEGQMVIYRELSEMGLPTFQVRSLSRNYMWNHGTYGRVVCRIVEGRCKILICLKSHMHT